MTPIWYAYDAGFVMSLCCHDDGIMMSWYEGYAMRNSSGIVAGVIHN